MTIQKLAHYAVRAPDLERSRRFYIDVLGLREGRRPPFPFPGVWLYLGDDELEFGVVHLIGTGAEGEVAAYLGIRDGAGRGTGALDHIAFLADDWEATRNRCRAFAADFTERVVPGLGLRQMFVTDPGGIVVELNFPAPRR